MEDAPRILKSESWRENLLPGNLKEMHFWARSVESCKSVQRGVPTDPFLLLSTAGSCLGPGGFAVPETIPRSAACPAPRLRVLPRVSVTPGFITSLGWGQEFSGPFSLIQRQTLLL